MNEFTHGGADNELAVLAIGFEALTLAPNGRIVLPSDQGWHIQRFTQSGVARLSDPGFTLPLPGLCDGRGKPCLGHDLFGVGVAVVRA